MSDESKPEKLEKPIAIEHYLPENLIAVYSDGAQVMHTKNEFIITFFQVEHPVWPIGPDKLLLESVKSRGVARIVMSPDQMIKLVQVMNENLAKFIASNQSIEQIQESDHGE